MHFALLIEILQRSCVFISVGSFQVGVTKTGRQTVNKLAEAGWLYNKVRKYADSRSTDRAFGQVGQVCWLKIV